MDYEETNFDEATEGEDSLLEEFVEDDGDAEEELEEFSLDDVTEENEGQEQGADEDNAGSEGPQEPGYVQRRIAKAVAKVEAQFAAQIEAMEAQYAPIKERLMEMDAQELVRSGKVKDLETAMELVRYRQGQPAMQEEPEEQPRNEQGQFVSREMIATETRANEMRAQADKIIDKGGPDVIAEFNRNPEIKRKVIDGEMDMYDVAEYMTAHKKKRPPSPMRSSNGVNGQIKGTIMSMSDAQFDKLVSRVREGGVRFRE